MRWIVAVTLLIALPAHAIVITVDPSDYAAGTNLSHVQDGLSISRLTWPNGSPAGAPLPPTHSDVYATSCSSTYFSCLTSDGLGFGLTYVLMDYQACVAGSMDCGPTNALEFIFNELTSSVSMTLTWGSDAPVMYAYDIAGNLIETCNNNGNQCGSVFPSNDENAFGSILTIDRDQRDIYRIVAGGFAGSSFAHTISYSVPEPSTLALLSLGLLGFGLRRRRSGGLLAERSQQAVAP